MENIYFNNVKLLGGFWNYYKNLNKNSVVKNVYERFKETGRFDALKCNWRENMPNKPHHFFDSDVAKWIEGVAYILEAEPDIELEKTVDELIENICDNQRKDGYFNSYFITVEPSKIYFDRHAHELYCTGHMIEAAIAYDKATGKDKLLNCVIKNVDLIYKVFVEEKSANFVTPGHEEIELALLKLYKYKKIEKHLLLAKFFINQRGNNNIESENKGKSELEYSQSDCPVRDIKAAKGHSVRGGYLYTAMAMLAKIDNDDELLTACKTVFFDIINKKMSITGGNGSERMGERFSYEYDLPNIDVYNETCAAISLAMFAGALQEIECNSVYGDIIERIIYNGFISGVSLDGSKFFYTNPLEIDIKKHDRFNWMPPFERVKVFNCSCCPPNVVRMLASIQRYMYTINGNNIYCNQFAESETTFQINGKECSLKQTTEYPLSGKITFKYSGEPVKLFVRIPEWCVEYKGNKNNGYDCFKLSDGDTVTVELPLKAHFIEANPYVQDNSGRYAVQYGPLVYCMESIDNGDNLRDITLLENGNIKVVNEEFPAPVIYMDAERRLNTDKLYAIKNNNRSSFTARLIPYFCFANRKPSDMIVWTMVK